jgi:hypothetical protein
MATRRNDRDKTTIAYSWVLEWIKGIFQSQILLVIYVLSEVELKW